MMSDSTKPDSSQPVSDRAVCLFDDWFDPIEAQVRERVRGVLQAIIEGELDETLQRLRYGRGATALSGKNDGDRCQRSPARPSDAVADGHLRAGGNRGSARPAASCGRQVHGIEEQGVADLSAPHAVQQQLVDESQACTAVHTSRGSSVALHRLPVDFGPTGVSRTPPWRFAIQDGRLPEHGASCP